MFRTLVFIAMMAIALAAPPKPVEVQDAHDNQDRQLIPSFTIYTGCKIVLGSNTEAACLPFERCRISCRCRRLLKDRFAILCGVKPPLFVIRRSKHVVRNRGGAIFDNNRKLCGC